MFLLPPEKWEYFYLIIFRMCSKISGSKPVRRGVQEYQLLLKFNAAAVYGKVGLVFREEDKFKDLRIISQHCV